MSLNLGENTKLIVEPDVLETRHKLSQLLLIRALTNDEAVNQLEREETTINVPALIKWIHKFREWTLIHPARIVIRSFHDVLGALDSLALREPHQVLQSRLLDLVRVDVNLLPHLNVVVRVVAQIILGGLELVKFGNCIQDNRLEIKLREFQQLKQVFKSVKIRELFRKRISTLMDSDLDVLHSIE